MANKQFNTYEIVGAEGSASTDLNGTLKLTNSIKGIDPSGIIGASYAKYAVGTEQVFTFTLAATSTTVNTIHKITFDTDEDDSGQAKKYSFTHVALAGALTTALIIDALDAKIQAHQDYSKFPFVVTNTATTLVLTMSSTKVSGRIAGEFGVLAGSYSDDSGAITLTLPGSPTIGDEISFVDYAGTFDTNNLTVARNGKNINGSAADLTVATERAANTLVFTDNTQGWLLKNN